jgi:hypothetical protein
MKPRTRTQKKKDDEMMISVSNLSYQLIKTITIIIRYYFAFNFFLTI